MDIMDFSEWAKNAILTICTLSLSHLTISQLQSDEVPMVDCAMLIGCWLLLVSIAYLRGKPERSETIILVKTKECLAASPDPVPEQLYEATKKEEEIHSSRCNISNCINCTCAVSHSSKYTDIIEPETTIDQLIRLREKKEDLITELTESLAVVDLQEDLKRAAMEYYFGNLRSVGGNKRIGRTAYVQARGLYSVLLKIYREKEKGMKDLVEEIEFLEKVLIDERRCSGETLLGGPSHKDEGFAIM